MKNNNNKNQEYRLSLPKTSTAELRGKQSVRATFKLTEKAINALSIVAVHLGIKQKSLFDHLIEDNRALNTIASEFSVGDFKACVRVQKTFVLSRKTLSSLEKASRDFDAPRDALVEYSIQRLLPIIEREKEKHYKRKEILEELGNFMEQGIKLLEKSESLLGRDDPVFCKLHSMMLAVKSGEQFIESFVEKGKIIEDFEETIRRRSGK